MAAQTLPLPSSPNLPDYLWLPLIVSVIGVIATAFFSYLWTYLLKVNTEKEEKRLKRIDLIDRLLLETNKLNIILEKLRDDLESLTYFNLKNVVIATSISGKLKTLSDNAILFPDRPRRETIELIDDATSLIEEMNNLERFPVSEYTEYVNKRAENEREYRAFNVDLLKMGIAFKFIERRNIYEPKYTSNKKKLRNKNIFNDERLKAANQINGDFKRTRDESDNKLAALRNNTNNSRGLLNTRLLGILTEIGNITNNLNDMRTLLLTKKRHYIFFYSYTDL